MKSPISDDPTAAAKPTPIETRAPYITPLKMSLPKSSVPIKCCAFGDAKDGPAPVSSGGNLVITGAKIPARIIKIMYRRAITATLSFRYNLQ